MERHVRFRAHLPVLTYRSKTIKVLVDVHDFPLTGRTPSDFSVSIVSEAFHGKVCFRELLNAHTQLIPQ